MRVPQSSSLVVLVFTVLLVAAACQGQAAPSGDCLAPRDGKLVAVPCAAPGTPEPTATPTPLPTESSTPGGGSANTPSGSASGQGVFLGAGTCFICHTIDSVPQARGQIGPGCRPAEKFPEPHVQLARGMEPEHDARAQPDQHDREGHA